MADPNVPLLPDAGANAAASTEATNARMLNETVGKLIEAGGSSSADIVAALNTIAAAITSSLIGGTTGTIANLALVSKGTAGRALQATPLVIDPTTGVPTIPAQGGSEGGELHLGKPASGSTLTGDVIVDILADRIRIFEGASTFRGAFLDIAAQAASVGSRLVSVINSTLAQGDVIYYNGTTFVRLAAGTSGQFLQTNGAGANPQWAAAGGLVLLNSGTIGNQATLDIVLTSFTAYRGIKIVLTNVIPATDNVNLLMQVSSNGGSSYDSGASDYKFSNARVVSDSNTVSATNARGVSSSMQVGGAGIGNGAAEGITAAIEIFGQTSTVIKSRFMWTTTMYRSDDVYEYAAGGGFRDAAQDTDALRFLQSSGNFASGTWALYGYA